jgi:AcrR family transcriptional regulator
MAAGVELVREQGLGRVSVTSITRRAGVSNALFYWYFSDVDHLVRDALTEGVEAIRRAVGGAVAGVDDPIERVLRRLQEGLRLMEEDQYVAFLMQADARGWMVRPDFAAVAVGGEDVLFDIVRDVAEGQARGDIRDDIPAFLLASCVRSVFADTVARHLRGQTRVPMAAAIDAVTGFVRQGVASSGRLAAMEDQESVSTF